MLFMQTESVLQTKNRSGPAKNRFSVALLYDNDPKFLAEQCRPRSDLIRVCTVPTVCHFVCIFWMHKSIVKPQSNFRIITAIF